MVVVITGATRGIGRAIAEVFALPGNVLLLGARNEVDLYNTLASLQQQCMDCEVHAKSVDVADAHSIEAFAAWCKQYGATDILVNNAGKFVPGAVSNEPEGTLEEMIAVNLFSAYRLTRCLIPDMIKRKSGHIFNVCSVASLQAYQNGGSYSISKFALLGFSKNLREEMKPHGIKVTAIIPGAVYTDSWSGSGVQPERIMEANDIAKMVYATAQLSPQAVVEDIVLRPQLGDL